MIRRPTLPTTVVLVVIAVMLFTACVPRTRGDSVVVGRDDDRGAEPPTLPDEGVTDRDVVEAIGFDLTNRPDDQNYWSLSRKEATCAAEGIVSDIGAERLVALGYRPGTRGAGLADVGLSSSERDSVASVLVDCVDLGEMAAALLFGAGRIPPGSATCMARILDKAGVPAAWLSAWILGRPTDPLADDAAFSRTLSEAASVCLDPNALNWPFLRSPLEDDQVIDADAPAGSSNSKHPDDHRDDATDEGAPR